MRRPDPEDQKTVYRLVKREIIRTDDGSTTIRIADWDECYHSTHGAIQEAYHVFIKNGLSLFEGKPVSVLEIGFGTGLNAFITFLESAKYAGISYTGVEAYPVPAEEVALLNYVSELGADDKKQSFELMHESSWEQEIPVSENFTLTKRKIFFNEIDYEGKFDLIYFDAFGFGVQPELWSAEIFAIMYKALKDKGVLVTYAARGVIKRNMIETGFRVEKLAGPPGKREMMRAFKE
jgi:tRNA U34 5-methylaminomethyl-2-thiouridine-forming methyltransferase MnmC